MSHGFDEVGPKVRELGTALLYGLAAWSFTAVVMSVALSAATIPNVGFAAHALAVPVTFALVSFAYFRRPAPLRPFAAGLLFGALVLVMDRALDAQRSALATWLPAYASLLATWITGVALNEPRPRAA
jgi:hypothetical protein